MPICLFLNLLWIYLSFELIIFLHIFMPLCLLSLYSYQKSAILWIIIDFSLHNFAIMAKISLYPRKNCNSAIMRNISPNWFKKSAIFCYLCAILSSSFVSSSCETTPLLHLLITITICPCFTIFLYNLYNPHSPYIPPIFVFCGPQCLMIGPIYPQLTIYFAKTLSTYITPNCPI